MIRVENLRKKYPTRFGEKLVLDNVNFELQKGEKLGILGRNGAGKSTLIRLISGAEFPTSGRVVAGMSISWPLAFGGAFQDNLTGVDNVRFISRVYNQDFEHNLAFVEDFSELGDYLREEVRTYSSGMRARLAFAISMITEFDCFLIDEVSAVGDARFHARCNHELFERRADRAMIIVSHNTSYINNHCNKFGLLHDAKLKLYDDFEEAFSDFKTKIGLADQKILKAPKPRIAVRNRKQLIDTTNTSAPYDEAFANLTMEAHVRAQEKKWGEARLAYEQAFELYPFHGAFWAQWAHVVKEAGDLELAEVGYRSSCALGESVGEMNEFFSGVVKKLKRDPSERPLMALRDGPTYHQPPSIPDLQLFARACWGVENVGRGDILALLGRCDSCDGLLAAMIEDDRFSDLHKEWLEQDDKKSAFSPKVKFEKSANVGESASWVLNLACIAEVGQKENDILKIAKTVKDMRGTLPVFLSQGGFADWPETRAAIQERIS
ncbi:ATP-binding cassette domain-containing protein [uncultured Erythrobacter sp.]|uniref:ABC transporter ATP-binding protein n=1 Tax=uncultured Erythrobacter sp. TaxID=263913 RepID=UPI00345D2DB6